MTAIDTRTDHPAQATTDGPDTALWARARRRVLLKRGLLMHALVYAVVNLGLFALHLASGGERGLHVPLWGWGLGLAIHALVVTFKLQGEGYFDRQVADEVERLQRRG